MDTWTAFKEDIANYQPVKPGSRVLLAVSGGPDSVCLTHLFWRLSKTMPLTLFIAHLDHGLRRESRADAAFVRTLGNKLGVEVIVETIDVKRHADRESKSLETAGRDERYRALAGIAKRLKCGIIATGHNANDNAETVLMWLIRGTGPDGLCGIPRSRPHGRCTIIRPLLSLPRRSIINYLKSQRLSYRTDRSNRSEVFTRNRIRHSLFPVLESFNPRLVEHLTTVSKLFTDDSAVLRSRAAAAARRCVRIEPDRIHLDLNMFFRYNKPTQMRVLKSVLPEKRTAARIEQVMRLIVSKKDGVLKFSGAWDAEKKAGKLRFTRR
jgi:tRNA(Ile)-lysidine synthase